ncbi:MAG: ECF transporter S component [Lachnospiraceae bacterium]|nr:ECF transporter S component [Lachnospiraceae bacterium]
MSYENQTAAAVSTPDQKVKALVVTAFFAAITYLGIQVFRIPMPAAVGTPFVHFGHIFVVMGVLLQGGKRGAVSGTLGLIIFDLLNGFAAEIPQVFAETVVKALITGAVFALLMKKNNGDRRKEYPAAMISAFVYAVVHVLIEFIAGTIKMVVMGSGVTAAMAGSLASIPAVLINAGFMLIAVAILYQPVSAVYKKMM